MSTNTVPSNIQKLNRSTLRKQCAPEQLRVLLVDDDDIIAALLEAILNSVGVSNIDITMDGLQAVTRLQNANPPYDLVLCDWNMPGRNGLEVHQAMRAIPSHEDSCFMLVSGVTESEKIRAALATGVDDYIAKPIARDGLLATLAQHFSNLNIAS